MPETMEQKIAKMRGTVHASTFSIPQPQRSVMVEILEVMEEQQKRIRALEKRFEESEG